MCAKGNGQSELTVRGAHGSILGRRDMAGLAQETKGYMRIKRIDLVDVLLGAAERAKILIYYNKRIVRIEEGKDKVTATFSDGTIDTADILLGCDGIHSSVRKLYVDPLQEPEYSGLASIFTIIPASSLSASTIAQTKGMNATITQEGMFLAIPCTATGDEIMWGFSQEVPLPTSGDIRDGWEVHARDEVKGFKDKMLRLLQDAQGEWGTAMREIIDATPTVKFYPVYRLPLGGSWYKGRCLLVGDAAHAMQPHAGQGVSMAVEDAFLLARLLQDEGRALGDVFQRFDEIRRPRVTEMYKIAARNVDVRQKTGPWGLAAKQLAIRVYLWASGTFGWDSASRVGDLTYDIEEV
jgi:2-polyprenyl-6-methoxyphenol hydroxylase-like FAD-dependent oxidoreductase